MARIASLALTFLCCLSATEGRAAERQQASDAVMRAFDTGNYDVAVAGIDAEVKACEAARQADDSCFPLYLAASSINSIAGHGEIGLDYALRAVTLAKRVLPDSLDEAWALAFYATLVEAQGRPAEAEPLHRRVLALRERLLPPGDTLIARANLGLAVNAGLLGRLADAEVFFRKTIDLYLDHPDPDPVAVANASRRLAYNLLLQARVAEAESLFRNVLTLYEAIPPPVPELAAGYDGMAQCLAALGRYGEAEPFFRKALALREGHLPAGHPDVASAYGGLAGNLQDQGKLAEAEVLYRRALAISEQQSPPDGSKIAGALSNLAVNLGEQKRVDDAIGLHRRALALLEKAYPDGHPNIAVSINNIAAALSGQGRCAEAEPMLHRAIAISKLPEGHPGLGSAYTNLATCLATQRRYAETEKYSRLALAAAEKNPDPDHPTRIMAEANLALVLGVIPGKAAEMRTLYRRAEARAMRRVGGFSGFDGVAQAELRRYKPIFQGEVVAAWVLTRLQSGTPPSAPAPRP